MEVIQAFHQNARKVQIFGTDIFYNYIYYQTGQKVTQSFSQVCRYFCQLLDRQYILAVSNCLADNRCLANGSLASCVRHNCAQLLAMHDKCNGER